PNGRKIDLKVALIKSDDERADGDLVVFFAGGPGQAAVDTYPQIAAALAPLRKHHHILLVDQPRPGESRPPARREHDERDKAGKSEEEPSSDTRAFRERLAKCLAKVQANADPTQYTTTNAVRDLEALRQALGAPQFDLVGVSYGMRMAQQYLMRHPEG